MFSYLGDCHIVFHERMLEEYWEKCLLTNEEFTKKHIFSKENLMRIKYATKDFNIFVNPLFFKILILSDSLTFLLFSQHFEPLKNTLTFFWRKNIKSHDFKNFF